MKRKKMLIFYITLFAIIAIAIMASFIVQNSKKSVIPETGKFEISGQVTSVPSGYIGIYSASDLVNMKNDLAGQYILMTDLNMGGISFEPIGDSTKKFTGVFEGNFHTISNLTITSSNKYIGMFGNAGKATIENFTLENLNITQTGTNAGYIGGVVGNAYQSVNIYNVHITKNSKIKVDCSYQVGGIAGEKNLGEMQNCSTEGTIEVEKTTGELGGLVGRDYHSTIKQSHSSMDITVTSTNNIGYNIGGAIGSSATYTEIYEIYATGNITIRNNSSNSSIYAGGLIGKIQCEGGSAGISKVYATGNIDCNTTTSTTKIGGLFGWAGSAIGFKKLPISNAFATGNIISTNSSTSTSKKEYQGGLIGDATTATIKNCYSTGSITSNAASTYKGGLVGNSSGNVTSSYWCKDTSGMATSAKGTGKSLTEMQTQSTFTGWDFTNTWQIAEGRTYPVLMGMDVPPGMIKYFSYLEVTKKNTSEEGLSGAKFAILNSYGTKVSQVTSGTEGKFRIEDLSPGNYILKETQAPSGYLLNETEYAFTMTDEGIISFDKDIGNTIYNEKVKAEKVTIGVQDAESKEGLSGAVIGLYDVNENAILNSSNNQIKITTDASGEASFKNIEAGTYKYKETKAPTGYMINNTFYKFTVSDIGEVTFETDDGIIYNQKPNYNICISAVKEHNKAGIPNLQYTITGKNTSGKQIINITQATDADGNIVIENVEKTVTLTIKPVSTPDKYKEQPEEMKVKITNNTSTGELSYSTTDDVTVNITNRDVNIQIPIIEKINIHLIQKDGEKEVIGGKYQIVQPKSKGTLSGEVVEGGLNLVGERLPKGTHSYTLKQTESNIEYKSISQTTIKATYDEDGNITKFTSSNSNVTAQMSGDDTIEITVNLTRKAVKLTENMITIVKYEKDTTNALSGAKIAFYKESGSKLLDSENTHIQLTTNSNGIVDLSNAISIIDVGKYKYKETVAPTGYKLDSTMHTFEVKSDGTVVFTTEDPEQTGRGVIYNQKLSYNINIKAVKEHNKVAIPNVQYTITGTNTSGSQIINTTQTTDTNGNIAIENVEETVNLTITPVSTPTNYIEQTGALQVKINNNVSAGTITYSTTDNVSVDISDRTVNIEIPIKEKINIHLVQKDGTKNIAGGKYEIVQPQSKGTLSGEVGADGLSLVGERLPAGTHSYTLQQTESNIEYASIAETKIQAIYNGYGNITSITSNNTQVGVEISGDGTIEITVNLTRRALKLTEGMITVIKYEENTTKPVEGAKIEFYKEDGSKLLKSDNTPVQLTTNSNGIVDLSNAISIIDVGKYKYKEIEAPTGYELNEDTYTFEVKKDGTIEFTTKDPAQTSRGIMYNAVTKVEITAKKEWVDENNKYEQRPNSVILKIISNGVEMQRKEVGMATNWMFTASLRKYDDSKNLIPYEVDEEEVNEEDLKYYNKAINNYTVTNTFQLPENEEYTVEHYKQNDTLNGYTLAETEKLTGKTFSIATATPKKYEGYMLNPNVKGTIMRGKIILRGKLVLKMFYDKARTSEFELKIVNLDEATKQEIKGTKYDITIRYEDKTQVEYKGRYTDGTGSIAIPRVIAKNITRVIIKQTEISQDYAIDKHERFAEINVVQNGKIELTGNKSLEIITDLKGNTLKIVQLNRKKRNMNTIRITAQDETNHIIKIGNINFSVGYPDGKEEIITTNESGIAQIENIPTPGIGTYRYEIKQKSTAKGYQPNRYPIYVDITFDELEQITKIELQEGTAEVSLLTEAKEDKIEKVANIVINQKRNGNKGPFGDYRIKIIERDIDTRQTVEGITYSIVQTGNDSGETSLISTIRTTDSNGTILEEAVDTNEIKIKVKRTNAIAPYVLIPEEIEVIVRKNAEGNYVTQNNVNGVTIDTQNKLIIINREIRSDTNADNLRKGRINNTVYITKVDRLMNVLGSVPLELRELNSGDYWDLLTDINGEAKLVTPQNGNQYPSKMITQPGELKYRITEDDVPVGAERILEEDIGFNITYEQNPWGGLEITSFALEDGISYDHIADLEYNQQEMSTYTQVDIMMKVINDYTETPKITLNIEKVDEQNKNIKLENATFEVIATYPGNGKNRGTLKTLVTTDVAGKIAVQNLRFPRGTTTVQILEKIAPRGYVIDNTPIIINVTNNNGQITVEGAEYNKEKGTMDIQIGNNQTTTPYNIYIHKRDKANSEIIPSTTKFEVTITDSTGVNVKEITTIGGKAKIEGLNSKGAIEVKIKEIEAPIGYEKSETVKTIMLTKDNLKEQVKLAKEGQEDVRILEGDVIVDIYNEESLVPKMRLMKVDEEDEEMLLSNAEFKVTFPNGETKKVTTQINGRIFIELKEKLSGRYEIEELNAPKHYTGSKKVAVDIAINNSTNEITQCEVVNMLGDSYVNNIPSKEISNNTANLKIANKGEGGPYELIVNKVDSVCKGGVNGAKFDINVKGEIGYSTTKSTSNDGIIDIKTLRDTGEITIELQEIKGPKDYIADMRKKEFKIRRDVETKEIRLDETSLTNMEKDNIKIENQTIEVTIENEAIYKNKLIIENRVMGNPDKKISGSTFEVGKPKPQLILGTETTNNAGMIEINLGQEGTREVEYTIKTTKINNTYRKNEDVKLKITYKDGTIQKAEVVEGEKDFKERIIAEVDPSVPYAGQHEMKLIINNYEFPETELIIENEDIQDNNIKISGSIFRIEKEETIIGSGMTNREGLTHEINFGRQKETTIEYKIRNMLMSNDNYKENKDAKIRIVYDVDGNIEEVQITEGEKDYKERIVVLIDDSLPYIGNNKIKIKIRSEVFLETKLKIINENIDNAEEKIVGTTFRIINSKTSSILGEEETNGSGQTQEMNLGIEKGTQVEYTIKNINMKDWDYKTSSDVKLKMKYDKRGEIESAEIIEGGINEKRRITAEIDTSKEFLGRNEITIIIRCEKYPTTKLILENEDIEDEEIKIEDQKFKVTQNQKQRSGQTDATGIIDGIIDGIYHDETVEYIIENTGTNERYNKTNLVKLQIDFNDKGKIENARITEGDKDTLNRVISKIDPNVNYIGENQIKIKIRNQKKAYAKIILESEDIDDNTIKIPKTTFKALEEGEIRGQETTDIIGLTKEIEVEAKRNERLEYTIITQSTPLTYEKGEDVGLEITYNLDGTIQSAQIISGEKDELERMVAEIVPDYVGKDNIRIKIRSGKSEKDTGTAEEDNYDKRFGVLLEKVSKRNKNIKVEGAEYRITVLNESTGEIISKVDNTDRTGQINFLGIRGSGVFQVTIEEMNTPENYIKDENIHTIRINTYEDSPELEILEENIGKNVELRPDNLNEKLKVIVKEASEGIELGIAKKDYDDNKILLSDCKFRITNKDTNEELVTGSNGMEKIALDLKEPGRYEYKIEEIQVTEEYAILPQGAVTLVIEYADNMIKSAKIIGEGEYAYISEQTNDYVEINILNKKMPSEIKYDLEIIKSDAYYSNIVLKGAELQVKINNEVGMTGITVLEETDENGKVEIKDICGSGLASIEISELTPPEDRKFDTKVKSAYFKIDKENNWISLDKSAKNVEIIKLDNTNKKIVLRIRNYADEKFTIGADKVERFNEHIKLSGAQYEVTMEESTETLTLEDCGDVMTLTGLEIPDISTNPTTFTYTLKEKVAPEGYLLDETPIVLKVEVTKVNNNRKITNAYIESGPCEVKNFGEGFVHLKLTDIKEVEIEAIKKWVDNSNKANKRPESVKIELYQNGEKYKEQTLAGGMQEDEWKHTFKGQPKYDDNGIMYQYTLDEQEVNEGDLRLYKKEIKDNIIENTFFVPDEKVEVEATKKWLDNNNEVGNRPESIIIELYQNGEKYKEQIVTGNKTEQEWKYIFEELPKFDINADDYIYTIDEREVNEGDLRLYQKITKGIVVENILEKTEITVTKKWVDNQIQKVHRPEKIKLQIKQTNGLAPDGVTIATIENPVVVAEKELEVPKEIGENGITTQEETFMLPIKDQNDQIINYIADEEEVNEGDLSWYIKQINQDTHTITNTFKTLDVKYQSTITKIWEDENNKNEKRPQSIVIEILEEDTVVKSEIVTGNMQEREWTHTFEGLIKYDENGEERQYHINEREVTEGDLKFYEKTINGNEIINTFFVPTTKIEKEITKKWIDNNNEKEKRPESIIIDLYQNGEKYKEETLTGNMQEEEWKYTFKELPKYDNRADEYVYTIDEREIIEGDLSFYNKKIEGTRIINKLYKMEFMVTKKWVDNEIQKVHRPEKIKLQVKQTSGLAPDGETIVTPEKPITVAEKEIETVKGSGENGITTQTETFILPMIDKNDQTINYIVDEAEVNLGDLSWYIKQIDQDTHTVTNTFETQDVRYEATINKIWEDEGNKNKKRPQSIIIDILEGDTVIQSETVTGDMEEREWAHTFEGLIKYDENGEERQYHADEREVNEGDLKFYQKTINGNEIINTFNVPDEKVEKEVIKIWEDNDNVLKKRPEKIILQIKRGEEVVTSKQVSAEENWKYNFTDLPKYDEKGDIIEYTVSEQHVNEDDLKFYQTDINENTITNTFKIPDDKIEVEAIKKWEDNKNEKGKRPQSIIIELYQNGEKYKEETVTGNMEENEWKQVFAELPKYNSNAEEYVYSIDEKEVTEGDLKFYEKTIQENIIINTFKIPEDTLQAEIIKKWEDENNKAGKRPSSIIFKLYRNGETYKEEIVTGNMEENEWKHIFTSLPKYDNNAEEYMYSIDEKEAKEGDLKFYEKTINGNEIVNTFNVPDTRKSITITKKWVDEDNKFRTRPEKIKLLLINNENEIIGEKEVTEKDNYQATFNDLKEYDEYGNVIEYLVDEKEINEEDLKFYTKTINGLEITNTLTSPEDKIEITVTKKWEDENNKAGKRPQSIKLQIKENEEIVREAIVNEQMNWTYTFKDLSKYNKMFQEALYTIDETEVSEGDLKFYEKTINGNEIINTFNVPDEKIEIEAIKQWNDENNKAGKRPQSVILQLIEIQGDGTKKVIQEKEVKATTVKEETETTELEMNETLETKEIKEESEWKCKFEELQKYDSNGNIIMYEIDEREAKEGDLYFYKKIISGNVVTNIFNVPDIETEFTVIKIWEDENDKVKRRPESIKLQLKLNEKVVATQEVGEKDNWQYTFTGLKKYDEQGDENNYTFDEAEVNPEDLIWYTKQIQGNQIINTMIPHSEETEITIKKVWKDEDNLYKLRPEGIKVQILNEQTVVKEIILKPNEKGEWEQTVTGLQKYGKGNKEIKYTIKEQELKKGDLAGYNTQIEGNTITNTIKPEYIKTDITINKIWEDDNNRYKVRPESVKVLLKTNKETVEEIILTQNKQGLWTHTFENLPKYDTKGNIIHYQIEEKEVNQDDLKYYETQIDGYTIINKFKKESVRFNLKLDKVITGIETNGELKEMDNKKMVKKEVKGRKIKETNIQYIYAIKVINESNVQGSAILVEDIPEGLEFIKEQNQNWKEDNGRIIIPINEIKANETKEYQIKLKWKNDEYNFGKMINTAHLEKVSNVFDVREETTEDNVSSSTIIMSVETGKIKTYSAIISVILMIIAGLATEGRHIIKKKIKL